MPDATDISVNSRLLGLKDVQVHVEDYGGEGRPVVLIHGRHEVMVTQELNRQQQTHGQHRYQVGRPLTAANLCRQIQQGNTDKHAGVARNSQQIEWHKFVRMLRKMPERHIQQGNQPSHLQQYSISISSDMQRHRLRVF